MELQMNWHPEGNICESVSKSVGYYVSMWVTYRDGMRLKKSYVVDTDTSILSLKLKKAWKNYVHKLNTVVYINERSQFEAFKLM